MIDPELAKYFKFDEADLEANRKGYLTQKQLSNLGQEARSQAGCNLFIGLILLVVAIFPILILYFSGALAFFGFAGLTWAIWPIVWGAIAFFLIRSGFSKPTFAVQRAEGPINIVKTQHSDSEHHTYYDWELHVGGHEFDVESDLADHMFQGDTYAIYFNEDPQEIVSVEKLASARQN